MKLRDNFC
uniref:Uncharacterized protein n=1 Tax=Arundo donax TaxID=35708 RepID=A0A0A9BD95_ARUDO